MTAAAAHADDRGASRGALTLLIIAGGLCSLATEMAGARLLAPYFGTSNLVWANVIGLILLYLSVGYWVGGRLADRYPDARILGLVVLCSAVTIAALPFISRPLFSAAASAFDGLSAGAYIASFFGTMALFALPVTALGAVSPWVIRLAVRDVAETGTVVGRMYALSTLGSLAGTFLPVLVLVPLIGTQRTLIVIAAVLALAALPVTGIRFLPVPIAIALLLLVPPGATRGSTEGQVIFEGESQYQYVQVVQQPNGDRVLHLNEGWAIHSILPASGPMTGGYWDAFAVLPLVSAQPDGRVAILGNAGGTISNIYAAAWPNAPITGVEIDPLVSSVGRKYLGMGGAQLQVATADARVWLRTADRDFGAMVVDAYRQPYIPFHLVSREFFGMVRDHLRPGGVVAINVGTPPGQLAAVDVIGATMRREFPTVLHVRFDEFNSVLFAFRTPTDVATVRRMLGTAPPLVAPVAQQIAAKLEEVEPGGATITDDHAPIEWITDRALLTYLSEGAPGAAR